VGKICRLLRKRNDAPAYSAGAAFAEGAPVAARSRLQM
jgi:hypothetical protein